MALAEFWQDEDDDLPPDTGTRQGPAFAEEVVSEIRRLAAEDMAVQVLMSPDARVLMLEELLRRPLWMRDSACQEHPEVNWFPERGEDTRPAKAVCAGCLVRQECLDLALEQSDKFGIWGGMSERERRRIRKTRTIAQRMAGDPKPARKVVLCPCGQRVRPAGRKVGLCPECHKVARETLVECQQCVSRGLPARLIPSTWARCAACQGTREQRRRHTAA